MNGFNKRATHPMLWHDKALNLARSAKALWPDQENKDSDLPATPEFGIHSVSLMLMGLAIEALLKGIILHENPSLADGSLHKSISKHGLIDLCQKAGIEIEDGNEERVFLNRLTDQVLWASKYPIPRTQEHMISGPHSGGKIWIKNVNDLKHFEQLWDKFSEAYQSRTGHPKADKPKP